MPTSHCDAPLPNDRRIGGAGVDTAAGAVEGRRRRAEGRGEEETAEAEKAKKTAEAAEDPLLTAVGHDPVRMDTLIARTGWRADEVSSRLLILELEGRIKALPGGLYVRSG